MEGTKYTLDCLDSKYDQENGFLVNYCYIRELNEKRFCQYSKDDFSNNGQPATDADMHELAKSFKGKPYIQIFRDDPNITKITPENQEKYVKEFNRAIDDELEKVAEGLSDPGQIIKRKLGKMTEDGKINAADLVRGELDVKRKLGGATDV